MTAIGANAFLDSGLLQIEIDSADVVIDAAAFDGTSPVIVCKGGSTAEAFASQYGITWVYDD